MKYECKNCNYGPCSITTPGCMVPTFACPFLDKQTKWLLSKDPPQAEDDEIVKTAEKVAEYFSAEWGKRFRVFAQAIAARADAGSAKIEKLEDKIESHKMQPLGSSHDHTNYRTLISDLERKVEELEKKIKNTNINLDGHCQRPLECVHGHRFREPKPQPKGGVALDKEGMPHDLIPGVSVYELPEGGCERIFHHQVNNTTFGYQCLGSAKVADWLAPDRTEAVTWLRDLDFPPHMGGDK